MPNWANLMLTKKGKALQAKAVAGAQLTITKMKLGSGTIPDGTSPEDLNDLIDPKQNLGLTAIEAQGNLAKIQSLITNADLADGYYIRECGVFAQDPDLGEILYAIMTDMSPDFLPPSGGSVVISEEFSINIAMENVSHITAIIDPDGLATVTNAKKIAADAIEAHNASEGVHCENIASKEEAEAQTNQNNIKFMTPLRVWDAIKKFANSPALTGTPTAPTAAKTVNNTQIATTAFVHLLADSKAQLNSSNTFTALNKFSANLAVSNGTTAGSGGRIDFGISPADETVQARISADNLGGLFYHTSTSQAHVFRSGTNNDVLSIRTDSSKMWLASNNQPFATVPYEGVATWIGNAKTATKLETARTINGVEFDGTKDITIHNIETFIDLLPVGWVSYKEFLLPQHVKANGATVNRRDYPTLEAYVTEHNLWTDDPASEPYKYGRGDGSTTMVLPDYRNRVIQGGDLTGVLKAGLPNITGAFSSGSSGFTLRSDSPWAPTGAFFSGENTSAGLMGDGGSAGFTKAAFDASKSNIIYGNSNTVQPPALQLIPQIKF